MNKTKKKIVVIALIACVLAISVASSTMAYFTDHEQKDNTFTFGGGVEITLTDNSASDGSFVITAPGQVIDQSPTVTNVSTDPIYVGAIVTLKSINNHYLSDKIALNGANGKIDVLDFLSGGAFSDGTTDFLVKAAAPTLDTFVIYIVYNKTLASNEALEFFDGIKVPNGWDTAEMQYMSDLNFTVQAYATQSVGFNTAEQAMQGAFGGGADATNNHFAGYFTTN